MHTTDPASKRRAQSARRIPLVHLVAALATACGGPGEPVYSGQVARSGPPSIASLIDLGPRTTERRGTLDRSDSDGRFFPSEFVAIEGRHLHGLPITLDGHALQAEAHLSDGSVVVRLPPSLSPGAEHLIKVGAAQIRFDSSLFLIASDTDRSMVRLIELHRLGDDIVAKEDPIAIPHPRALYHATSADGSLLYSVALESKEESAEGVRFTANLRTFVMGGKDIPRQHSEQRIVMGSHPTALTITGNQLLLLTTHDLVRLDLRTKDSPKLLAHHHLVTEPQARLIDMAVLGSHVYVLDAVDNRLICVSLDSGQVVGTLELGPGKGYPYSVAITTDRHQPNQLRILQGPNLRLGAYELGRLGAAAKSGIGKLPSYLGQGLHVVREQMNGARAGSPPAASTAPGDAPVPDVVTPAPVGPTTPTIGESQASTGNATADGSGPDSAGTTPPADVTPRNAHGALLSVQVAGETMTVVAKDALPDAFVPVDIVAYRDGFAVSGVAPGELDVSMLQPNFDTVKLALRFLKDSVQLGRVLYIAPDGGAEILQQGTATYLELATLPDGRLVYSGMRLTGSALPPFVGLGWGVGLQGGHFHTLSKLGVQYLVPPYSYGQVSVQGDQLDALQ